jgi:mRNA-degrading endonuclease toxin of MazEF toxin-antitoxin module
MAADKRRLKNPIGVLSGADMRALEAAIRTHLGLRP